MDEAIDTGGSRRIAAVRRVPVSRLDARLSSREIHQVLDETERDPYLVVSLFDMAGPVFPPHPHAGFTVATYLLPESENGFINQDSLGTRNVIKPGGLHATVAGAGVLHEEQPITGGGTARGYQIWIDHANGARSVPPRPETLEADEVPTHGSDSFTVRVLVGESGGVTSPVDLPTAVRILDADIGAGATWREALRHGERGFLVVLGGTLTVGLTVLREGDVATLDSAGSHLDLVAGDAGARLTLFLGQPLHQPRVHGGPVVGGTRSEVDDFLRAARAGAFGRLEPFREA